MSEREYIRLRKKIGAVNGGLVHVIPDLLPKTQLELMWRRVASCDERPPDSDPSAVTAWARVHLSKYVECCGPFLYEEGRCLFIDVAALDWNTWRWPNLPVVDVTYVAQHGFLTEFKRDPKGYFQNNWMFLTLAFVGIVASYIFTWLLDRIERVMN